MLNFSAVAIENILIYSGPGVGPNSLANTVSTIKSTVGNKYSVKTVGPEVLVQKDWMQDTALLIMPGGADIPYMEMLRGQANSNIKLYVENGGKYIGICAGAYYSADRIEFAKGDSILEVIGERELKFFPGVVIGPTYSGFSYNAEDTSGLRAAKVFWQELNGPFRVGHEFVIFYYGGGHFVNAEAYPNVTILARYGTDTAQQPVAIVECKVGAGKAILSGVHFEWDLETLDVLSPNMRSLKEQLQAKNADRKVLIAHLLSRLDIAV